MYSDEIFDELDKLFSKIMNPRGIKGQLYAKMAEDPITCALRLVLNYSSKKLYGEKRKIAILAAANLVYGAFSLDENLNYSPTVHEWFNLMFVVDDELSRDYFKEIRIEMLQNEDYDVCKKEREKYEFTYVSPWKFEEV